MDRIAAQLKEDPRRVYTEGPSNFLDEDHDLHDSAMMMDEVTPE